MTSATVGAAEAREAPAARTPAPGLARGIVIGVAILAAAAGLLATGAHESARAVTRAGPELTRLLRAMTLLKALMAAAASWGVLWRLATTASWRWLGAYAVAVAAMAVGPGLIWDIAHVTLGAVALHTGMIGSAVLLWRDPAVGRRLSQAIAARRAALAERKR